MVTVIDDVVAPLDQNHDVPPIALRVTLPPAQNVVAPDAEMVGVAGVCTLTDNGAEVAEQPWVSLTVTV